MKKILIIRLSSIGDIVLTTPVIRCLKTRVPEAEIHYLTKKQNHSLLQSNPYIDKVWLYDKNFSELFPAEATRRMLTVSKLTLTIQRLIENQVSRV